MSKFIFHEAPNSIFKDVQEMTDGDYCLVHLMDENETYRNLFLESAEYGNHIMLDNSIFELGEAYDSDRYYHWINELKPMYFIIPDVLNDGKKTVERMNAWFDKYETPADVKPMAVVQGSTYEELIDTYRKIAFDDRVGKIGISFDSSCYLGNEGGNNPTLSKEAAFMRGRSRFLAYLEEENIANRNKPHHLLGCSLPQEMYFYRNVDWIESVDTSSPVVNGLLNIKYSIVGLESKPSVKLFTLIDDEVTEDQWKTIKYNIMMFRSFCNQ